MLLTKAILRNQVHAGLWLACTWFKNLVYHTPNRVPCILLMIGLYVIDVCIATSFCGQIISSVFHGLHNFVVTEISQQQPYVHI